MSLPAPADALIGTVLDRYRIVSVIGKGGMGVVYEAEHTQLGKRVAIKLILETYANDPDAITRFRREALAASRIGSPHIVSVADIGTAPDGRTFVVMELLDGLPLSAALKAGPMPVGRAVMIIRQVLRAVAAAHAKGIVHRDLKPDNIFLVAHGDQQDFVKLLDFGVSKMIDTEAAIAATRLTVTGMVIGTPLYMAPEQALGNEIDHLADIYACGVMLYEMLTGKPPFDGATYAVLVAKLLTQEPPRVDQVRAGLPASLVVAVHRALDKDPPKRFASADAFAAALPGERVSSGYELAQTIGSVPSAPAAARRWPWIAASTAMAVAIAAVIVVYVTREHPSEPAVTAESPPRPAGPSVAAEPKTVPLPTTGMLEVKSNPTGAQVTIDGRVVGSSPLVVTLLAGPHRVHIEAAGHAAIDESEDVAAGERTSVVVALVPVAAPTRIVRPKPLAKSPEPVAPAKAEPVKSPPPPLPAGAKPNPY